MCVEAALRNGALMAITKYYLLSQLRCFILVVTLITIIIMTNTLTTTSMMVSIIISTCVTGVVIIIIIISVVLRIMSISVIVITIMSIATNKKEQHGFMVSSRGFGRNSVESAGREEAELAEVLPGPLGPRSVLFGIISFEDNFNNNMKNMN